MKLLKRPIQIKIILFHFSVKTAPLFSISRVRLVTLKDPGQNYLNKNNSRWFWKLKEQD